MAFGGSGFSFGSNNNQSTGFGSGGFGSNTNTNTNTNTGFGTSTSNTGFGSSTATSNPFGGGTSTFGNNTSFGSNNNAGSLFGGNKPATTFGSSTGTGLFGNTNNTNTTSAFGSGGFGGTSTGFGSNTGNTGSTFSFGNNKPAAFGTTPTSTPLFGQGGAGTTGGFGTSTSAFGSSGTGTALNQPVPPSEGTASTPFAPTTDKEANGTTNSYQSITFQQPYQKYSFEELRLADYNAGRRFGNGSGQAGAFGASSFGGFGSTNTGGFGSNNNTSTNPFGTATTTASTGFGSNTATAFGSSNTGGGLFGNTANKPGGLFGAQTTSSSTTGGLFGTAGGSNAFGASNTTGGFGSNTNSTPGLFGSNQNKPAGGLFGNTGASSTGGGLFGNNQSTNTGGGLFGNNSNANTGGGLFGNNSNTNTTGGGLFGSTNNQQKPGGLFGNTGGFGTATTQAQPSGGLFGTSNNAASNTGGGLFGNTNTNTNTGGGLFGNTSNNNTGGGLFGNTNQSNTNTGGLFGNNNQQNQNKPGGLFGNSTTGGGLFGNNTSANTGGGLFGNTSNTNTGGLFGNSQNKPAGGLFGNTSTNQTGGGLFGTSTAGGGLFGTSQNTQQQNQQQQDGVKHASLLDPNPYGQSSIWTGLPAASPENSKPVFTPLTASQKMKESMMKPPPSLRLNQSRYMTPPRRNGYGFSYSTYGTPNSAASTPGGAGLSGSMYGSRGWSGGSFGRSFNKSASVQNLRAQFASDNDEMWKPGAFASSGRHSSGSIKRLTIDRSIRNDLFSRPSQPALPAPSVQQVASGSSNGVAATPTDKDVQPDSANKLRKRVSFDNNTTGGQLNGETGALVRSEPDDEDEQQEINGEVSSRGNELAAVPEDRESNHVSSRSAEVQAKSDPKPGDYWMKPSRAEMSKLPREQLQKFKDFQVGRYGCGQVTFNGTVDLTALPLDSLYEKIVEIRLRSVTVYPDASTKPPVGKGLNVPSTIAIENSWPRARNQPSSDTSGPVFDKHINRLKKMGGTEFVDYEIATGVWTFRVPHYTRYGLDYDDDEDMSELTEPPRSLDNPYSMESMMGVDAEDHDNSGEDDTFAFKQGRFVPGGFGKQGVIDADFEPTSSALVPTTHDIEDDLSDHSAILSEEEYSDDEPSMAGAYPAAPALNLDGPNKPILKAPGTPGKTLLDLEGDWADQLQQTISPRKQNRDMLREAQSKVLLDRAYSPIKPKSIQTSFRNSVDVMSSIFGKYEGSNSSTANRTAASVRKGKESADFEFPYAKRTKVFDDDDLAELSTEEKNWLKSFKARFDGVGALVFRANDGRTMQDTQWNEGVLVAEGSNAVVRSGLKGHGPRLDIASQLAASTVVSQDGVPYAQHERLPFSQLADQLKKSTETVSTAQEHDIYALAHVLFDDYEDEHTLGLPAQRDELMPHIRRDRLTNFLSSYILRKHGDDVSKLEKENPIAAAVLKLTAHDIKGACDVLEQTKNYKLMLLVSQLEGASVDWQDDIKAQIDAWRDQSALSEMTTDVRALYEICSGNVTICQGKIAQNVPVEDKAATFALSEEFDLTWLQAFALGLWYGKDEKKVSRNGRARIEHAVVEFSERCARGEENVKPDEDVMWALLRVYAGLQGADGISEPVFPQALQSLNRTWDSSGAFRMHFATTGNIPDLSVDQPKADELAASVAWQLSSRQDLVGAAYALLHLRDAATRAEMIHALLERFAAILPEPPTPQNVPEGSDLWSVMTQQLRIPTSWLYTAKAAHARAVDTDGHRELQYLVAAHAWDQAHECFTHRVAPGCIIDADYDALASYVKLFGDDVETKIPSWFTGGGIFADVARLVSVKAQLGRKSNVDADLVESLQKRLVARGRELSSDGQQIDLGKLSVEELEERVAVKEMSGVVAGYLSDRSMEEALELPITSDLRLKYMNIMAGNQHQELMAGGSDQ